MSNKQNHIVDSNKKVTAVEWLESIEMERYLNLGDWRKAKEMEKEQIKDAFGIGCQVEATRLIGYHGMAEQYYKDTYEK
jgi:hypothetical protein